MENGEDQSGEVDQLRPILEEKRTRLKQLETEFSACLDGVRHFLAELERLQTETSSGIQDVEEALMGIKEIRRAQLRANEQDRAKLLKLLDRFRLPSQRIPDLDSLHPLSAKAVGSTVDRILEQTAPSETERRELLKSLAGSIKDESLRQILNDKLAAAED
jgi:hypothetical protein